MATYDDPYSKAAYTAPRVAAGVSILAIACTLSETVADVRLRQDTSVIRVLLSYQLPLLGMHAAQLLGQTPMPASDDKWGAIGTMGTCEAQGFVLLASQLGTLLWDACLSTVFLLMVRYNWTESKLRRLERFMHIVIWPLALLLPIHPLRHHMFNSNFEMCVIGDVPNNCEEGAEDCVAQDADAIFMALFGLVPVVVGGYSILVMLLIYRKIRHLERRNRQYDVEGAPVSRRLSTKTGYKGLLFASTLLVSTLGVTVDTILYSVFDIQSIPMAAFAFSMMGLLGFFNMLVFLARRREMRTAYGRLVRRGVVVVYNVFTKVLCGCRSNDDVEEPTSMIKSPSATSSDNERGTPAGEGSVNMTAGQALGSQD